MWSVRPSICHGLDEDSSVRTGNAFNANDEILIDVYGSASHNGGHCAFWYSTDEVNFYKIIDIKDCTLLDEVKVMLPDYLPSACETKCTFAWTWVPASSGACEIYMNCADISVAGVSGGDTTTAINFQTTYLDQSDGGCVRVDDSTHYTTIFGDVKTEYSEGAGTSNGDVEEGDEDTLDEVQQYCYINDTSPDGEIQNDGTCGTSSKKCDDGMCCSSAGYCGPTVGYYDANGNAYYCYWEAADDCSVYYDSEEAAFQAYCANNLGDWRFVECDGEKNNAPSAGAHIVTLLLSSLLIAVVLQ
jgi:hypothetical protein